MSTVKIKTKFGKLLTISIKEQTDEYISGVDKFGVYTKVLMEHIISCEPLGGKQ